MQLGEWSKLCVIFNATSHFVDSISLTADFSQVTQRHLMHFCCVPLTPQCVSIYQPGMSEKKTDPKPPPKLSYRSAIRKKVVFFAGSVWTLARTQGEVGGDQEPPGDTWRHPIPPKKIYLYKTWYGQQLLLVEKFCATHSTRGSLSKIGTDQYYSPQKEGRNQNLFMVHPDPEIRISGFGYQEPPGNTQKYPTAPKKIMIFLY